MRLLSAFVVAWVYLTVLRGADAGMEDEINEEIDNLPADDVTAETSAMWVCVPSKECINGKTAYLGQTNRLDRNGVNVPTKCKDGHVLCWYEVTEPDLGDYDTPSITPAPHAGTKNNNGNSELPACGFPGNSVYRSGGFSGYDEAEVLEFPWTVAIFQSKWPAQSFKTGNKPGELINAGSLIHPKVVLTAAHKFRRKSSIKNLYVRAGVHDISNKTELFPVQTRPVDEVITHKDYDSGAVRYDVALLILQSKVEDASNVGFACLPPSDLETQATTICYASGWGPNEIGGGMREKMKMVELPIVDRSDCLDALIKGGLSKTFTIHESMLCAGGEKKGQDTCTSDGGAPLVCFYPELSTRYYQAGITSFGLGCGVKGRPALYTAVNRVRDWIVDKMRDKKFSLDYSTPH